MARYTVTIPDWKPTPLNQLMRHPMAAARAKANDAEFVAWYAKMAGVPAASGKRRVSVRVTVAGAGRSPDPDGLLKSLLDALVTSGMLVDDGPKWIEFTQPEVVRGSDASTVITLEDVA